VRNDVRGFRVPVVLGPVVLGAGFDLGQVKLDYENQREGSMLLSFGETRTR
jgi:hypothetical protein